MANIRMRQGRYQAQVRRHGYPQATKTFTSITEAKKWVKATEIDMERQQFIPKISMTVREMLEKYEQICLPTHKGADTSEKYRVKMLKNYFGVMPLDQLTPAHLARYRDARLKICPADYGSTRLYSSTICHYDRDDRMEYSAQAESCLQNQIPQGRQSA